MLAVAGARKTGIAGLSSGEASPLGNSPCEDISTGDFPAIIGVTGLLGNMGLGGRNMLLAKPFPVNGAETGGGMAFLPFPAGQQLFDELNSSKVPASGGSVNAPTR
jgi:hypothetical protein